MTAGVGRGIADGTKQAREFLKKEKLYLEKYTL